MEIKHGKILQSNYLELIDASFSLENIIYNARDHGFHNQKRRNGKNIIEIKYFNTGSEIIGIQISNNGDPLIKGMDKKAIVTFGETSDLRNHTGTGGYEIQELMTKFGGVGLDISPIEDPKSEYTVCYKLLFKRYV